MPTEQDLGHPAKRLQEAAKQIRLASQSGEIGHADELSHMHSRLHELADGGGAADEVGRWDDRIAASEDVYGDARGCWGTEAQLAVLAEEAAELAAEASRELNGKGDMGHLLSEIVDVRIMLAQFRMLFSDRELTNMVDDRMDRLEAMLEEADSDA